MKRPWEEFLDIYKKKLAEESHDESVVDALVELMIRLDKGGWSNYGKRSAGLKDVTDRWHEEGSTDWKELRERLKHSWSNSD